MIRSNVVVSFLAVAVSCIFVFSGCATVPQEELDKKEGMIRHLNEQIQEQKTEMNNLIEENSQLVEANSALSDKVNMLEDGINILEGKVRALEKELKRQTQRPVADNNTEFGIK